MNASTSETHTAGEQFPRGREVYPALPSHVLERLDGYIGADLRKRMALRRAADTERAEQAA